MGIINIKRDGPVQLSQLDGILTKMDKQYTEVFEEVMLALQRAEAKIKKLEADLATERRLRLGKRP